MGRGSQGGRTEKESKEYRGERAENEKRWEEKRYEKWYEREGQTCSSSAGSVPVVFLNRPIGLNSQLN